MQNLYYHRQFTSLQRKFGNNLFNQPIFFSQSLALSKTRFEVEGEIDKAYLRNSTLEHRCDW